MHTARALRILWTPWRGQTAAHPSLDPVLLMSPRPGNSALAGNRVPRRHRFYLSDGRIVSGDLYRSPNSRLADHVAGLKGYISVVDAIIEDHGGGPNDRTDPKEGPTMEFIALNSDHVLFIEELEGDE